MDSPLGRVGRERVEGQGYRKEGAIMSRAEVEFVPATLGLGGEEGVGAEGQGEVF